MKKTFEMYGIKLERVLGSELSRRGRARSRYGYRLTHLKTGLIRTVNPSADHSVNEKTATLFAKAWSELIELENNT